MEEPIEQPIRTANEPVLDVTTGRVIGCLIEKAMTTPDHYPMSLNAIVVACNQVSNREPVVDYDEGLVERTLRSLADRGLAKMVHRPGDRVVKYRQALTEVLALTDQQAALMAVLMLRGPQTPGELRQRTIRYVEFESLVALEASLRSLQDRTPPLVERLDRRPGQKEYRYRQLVIHEDGALTASASAPAERSVDALDPEYVPESPRSEGDLEALKMRVDVLEQRIDALLAELGITGSGSQDVGDL